MNFLVGTNTVTGYGVNLCPLWFSEGGSWSVVLHEMGRYYNSMGEEFTNTIYDAYRWDNLLGSLCKNYDHIRAG